MQWQNISLRYSSSLVSIRQFKLHFRLVKSQTFCRHTSTFGWHVNAEQSLPDVLGLQHVLK